VTLEDGADTSAQQGAQVILHFPLTLAVEESTPPRAVQAGE